MLTTTISKNPSNSFNNQISGVIVDKFNTERVISETTKLSNQFDNYLKAIKEIDKVRDFSLNETSILGRPNTKHGEIAEHVEVGFRRADDLLRGKQPSATFDNVGRFDAADYTIDKRPVQSKFHNGPNNTLRASLKHANEHELFVKDEGGLYHIPKDQFEFMKKIKKNESVEGLSLKSINAIKRNIQRIESETGQNFEDVVKPAIVGYPDVQRGAIDSTINEKTKELDEENKKRQKHIRKNHKPNFKEGVKVAGSAAIIASLFSTGSAFYSKYKNEGKKFYKDFTSEDWKDVGLAAGKGASQGFVSGGAIYFLTNKASLAAPFAAAVVNTTRGIYELQKEHKAGNIDNNDLRELSMILCSQTAFIALSTFIGQTIVPLPFVGAITGALASYLLIEIAGDFGKPVSQVKKEFEDAMKEIDEIYHELLSQILATYDTLDKLTKIAFNPETNLHLFKMSIVLAREYNVDESKIINNIGELDEFMLR